MPFGSNALRGREPLSRHTTFAIGGPARFWYSPITSELLACHDFALRAGMPMLVLGGGSNCLVSDAGFDGLVVTLSDISIPTTDSVEPDTVVVSAGACTPWDEFVTWCCVRNYQGIECMAGIPGTVGGAVYGAIGANGQNVADVIEWVDVLNLFSSERTRMYVSDMRFEYRYSTFQDFRDVVILEVGFRLKRNQPARQTHPDIAQLLPYTAPLHEVAAGVRRIRERKGAMLWLPHRGHNRTAGSFFKNPNVSQRTFDQLSTRFNVNDERRWWWPVQEGFRISAAKLIEYSGFKRGYRDGDAAISPEHTLSLVNLGSATAADIIRLARRIQDGVHEATNIILQPEVRMIGFDRPPLG